MKDRAGQIYLTVGGLVVGAGASTLLAGLFTAFPLWGLITAAGVTALGAYVLLAALLDWPLPGRASSLAYVVDNARELSKSIATWAGDRRRAEPAILSGSWDENTERVLRHSTETMIRWNELFGVQALAAYDQLVAHGADPDLTGLGGRHTFEYPTNMLGIEEAGRTLGVMAAHLEAKKMTRS